MPPRVAVVWRGDAAAERVGLASNERLRPVVDSLVDLGALVEPVVYRDASRPTSDPGSTPATPCSRGSTRSAAARTGPASTPCSSRSPTPVCSSPPIPSHRGDGHQGGPLRHPSPRVGERHPPLHVGRRARARAARPVGRGPSRAQAAARQRRHRRVEGRAPLRCLDRRREGLGAPRREARHRDRGVRPPGLRPAVRALLRRRRVRDRPGVPAARGRRPAPRLPRHRRGGRIRSSERRPLLGTPAAADRVMGLPSPKTMLPPDEPSLGELRRQVETEWVPAMQQVVGVPTERLPVLWDADFLLGPGRPTAATPTSSARSTPAASRPSRPPPRPSSPPPRSPGRHDGAWWTRPSAASWGGGPSWTSSPPGSIGRRRAPAG